MYDAHDPPSDNQLWWEDRLGNIRSKMGDQGLEVADGKLIISPFDVGNPDQWWVREGERILLRSNPSQSLDIEGRNGDNMANLTMWEYKGDDNQMWDFSLIG